MGKKEYDGIVMDVTRYNSSKDMMRTGLNAAALKIRGSDNSTRRVLERMEKASIRIKRSHALYNSGYKTRWKHGNE